MTLVNSFTQITDDTLACLLRNRPDLLNQIYAQAPGTANSAQMKIALDDWWRRQATAGGRDTVGNYIANSGCSVNEPVSLTTTISNSGSVTNPWLNFAAKNPILVLGGGFLGLIALKKLKLI